MSLAFSKIIFRTSLAPCYKLQHINKLYYLKCLLSDKTNKKKLTNKHQVSEIDVNHQETSWHTMLSIRNHVKYGIIFRNNHLYFLENFLKTKTFWTSGKEIFLALQQSF